MRLHAPVTEETVLRWLRAQALEAWGPSRVAELDATLQSLSATLASLSETQLPDELEPLFP
jgi:hypothetical protein